MLPRLPSAFGQRRNERPQRPHRVIGRYHTLAPRVLEPGPTRALERLMDSIKADAQRLLYRTMAENNAVPACRDSASGLGVRVSDVTFNDDGEVLPGGGGMSVTPDDPRDMPPRLRPEYLGGTGKHPLWRVVDSKLPTTLQFRQDDENHGVVEPASPMTLETCRKQLCDTAPLWEAVNHG